MSYDREELFEDFGDDDVVLHVEVLRETEKARLVTTDMPDNAFWVPKSVSSVSATGIAGITKIRMQRWFAEKEGLV